MKKRVEGEEEKRSRRRRSGATTGLEAQATRQETVARPE